MYCCFIRLIISLVQKKNEHLYAKQVQMHTSVINCLDNDYFTKRHDFKIDQSKSSKALNLNSLWIHQSVHLEIQPLKSFNGKSIILLMFHYFIYGMWLEFHFDLWLCPFGQTQYPGSYWIYYYSLMHSKVDKIIRFIIYLIHTVEFNFSYQKT